MPAVAAAEKTIEATSKPSTTASCSAVEDVGVGPAELVVLDVAASDVATGVEAESELCNE